MAIAMIMAIAEAKTYVSVIDAWELIVVGAGVASAFITVKVVDESDGK